jgi:DNA-binding SARP family transcriptional activator
VGDAVSMVALVVLIAQITGSAEDSYRLLMRCYAWLGMRGRALRQYRLCEKILLQEYGTAPSMETRSLYRSLMGDESA